MTNPTLERAARALYEFGMMADCPTWDQFDQKYKEDFFDMARAVLMAVREPDEAMCDLASDAANDARPDTYEFYCSREMYLAANAAMIDAILNDGEGE